MSHEVRVGLVSMTMSEALMTNALHQERGDDHALK